MYSGKDECKGLSGTFNFVIQAAQSYLSDLYGANKDTLTSRYIIVRIVRMTSMAAGSFFTILQ